MVAIIRLNVQNKYYKWREVHGIHINKGSINKMGNL